MFQELSVEATARTGRARRLVPPLPDCRRSGRLAEGERGVSNGTRLAETREMTTRRRVGTFDFPTISPRGRLAAAARDASSSAATGVLFVRCNRSTRIHHQLPFLRFHLLAISLAMFPSSTSSHPDSSTQSRQVVSRSRYCWLPYASSQSQP